MSVLVYLIPISLALGLAALFGFIWTVRSRQYDDLDGPAHRILNDDQSPLDPRQAEARRRLDLDSSNSPQQAKTDADDLYQNLLTETHGPCFETPPAAAPQHEARD